MIKPLPLEQCRKHNIPPTILDTMDWDLATTQFTAPIRRYPDLMTHRLLQLSDKADWKTKRIWKTNASTHP